MPTISIEIDAEDVSDLVENMEVWHVDRALKRARNELMRETLRLYARTVRTWNTRPEFETIIVDGEGVYSYTISTQSAIYHWVDEGTGLHGPSHSKYPIPKPGNLNAKTLRFRTNYDPKTKVGNLTSRYTQGAHGPYVFRKSVMHPGIEGRGFTDQIGMKIADRAWETVMWAILDWWYHGHKGQDLPPSGATSSG